jgi:hypothetical protein
MQTSRSADDRVSIELEPAEAQALSKAISAAQAALVTLYARADMTAARAVLSELAAALDRAASRSP